MVDFDRAKSVDFDRIKTGDFDRTKTGDFDRTKTGNFDRTKTGDFDYIKTSGYCRVGAEPIAARAALYMWEEPCISGSEGSGTIFFCGCTLGCVYCQNFDISRTHVTGKAITAERLAEIFIDLQSQGANNINLVTPTMFQPHIITAVGIARSLGLALPVLYNTSGYELPERISELVGTVDVWLPDFKYLSGELAKRYSFAADYPEYARAALSKMVELCPRASYDERGIMKRGVIVRHLLLPGQLAESMRVVEYLYSEYQNNICYSLMNQYTPTSGLDHAKYPELSRRVTTYEYNKLVDYALSLGITNAYIQEGGAVGESFIPDFDLRGI
ncbi:MAG TPA: radical SAM protein [Firmicutes bacterium]|nr:radical SAM protein [Bacillota bacterium]